MAELEHFACAYLRDGERVTEHLPGVRVSKHFAFVTRSLVHIPSGYSVPYAYCWNVDQAKARAACLEALSFVDWSVKDPAAAELTEEQQAILRDAARGTMPPAEVANG